MDKVSRSAQIELSKIASQGARIRRALILDSTALTPVNFHIEREKFFKSKTYNPKFLYNDPLPIRYDVDIDSMEQRVENIDLPYDLMRHLIDYLNHLRFMYRARRSIGTPTFSIYASLAFDWHIPDPDKLLKLLPEFKFDNEDRGEMQNATQIAEALKKVLVNKYKITDFPVNLNHFTNNIIFVDFHQINIGKDIKRFSNNVKRLIVHEIESHALQNYNMKKVGSPLIMLSKLSDSNLYAEGLGVYNEVKSKTITKKAFKNYYYRLKSVRNNNLKFREIYEMLREEKLSEKHAYNIAYRVKRGMQDTSKQGGYPKDAAYLLGYKEILKFLKSNREDLLYCAKNPNITKLLLKYNLVDLKDIAIPKFNNEKSESI